MVRISYLRLSVTDRCNFRCKYCMPEGVRDFIPHPEILRYEEILELVKAFCEFGVDSVRLTGGEPLVRKGIENLVSMLSSLPQVREVTITTNGFFLAEKASSLKSFGLSRVNVSLDTLSPSKFAYITGTSHRAFFKVLEGIERAIEEGLTPVKVNTVVIKGFNDDEIGSFLELSSKLGVEVRFIELMPVGGRFFPQENFVPISKVKEIITSEFGELIPTEVRKKGPAKSFIVEGTGARVGFIPSVSQHFCHECNRVRLTSDGKLRLCLMSDRELDLKSYLRSPGYTYEGLLRVIRGALVLKSKVNGIEALESLGCSRKMFTIGG